MSAVGYSLSGSAAPTLYDKMDIRSKTRWLKDQFGKFRDVTEGTDLTSFDDESALCDPTSPTEKKHKSRGLSPKKLRSIVDGKKDKKSGKKDKKGKGKDDFDDFERFTSEKGKEAAPKDTEQWKNFEAMQERIKHAVESTHQKLTKMETDFDKELGKLEATTASNSPWGVAAPPHPSEGKAEGTTCPLEEPLDESEQPKIGWVGFEDDFSAAGAKAAVNAAAAAVSASAVPKVMGDLGMSPLPSPRHPPVPPNNSRRASGEADLLGLLNGDGGTSDLLGLGGDTAQSQPPQQQQPMAASLFSSDMLSLSRNPDESAQSSGRSTPAMDLGGCGDQGQGGQLTGAALDLVDDFLGISGQNMQKPMDPLEALLSKHAKKDSIEGAADNKPAALGGEDFLGLGGIDTASSMHDADDDDPFGLGTHKSAMTKPTTAAMPMGGDLFTMDDGNGQPDASPDEFTIPEVVKQIASGAINVAQSAPALQSPSSDDFDPRADIKTDAKPAADIAPPAKSCARARPRPRASAEAAKSANPFKLALLVDDVPAYEEEAEEADLGGASGAQEVNFFTSAATLDSNNPFAGGAPASGDSPFMAFGDESTGLDLMGNNVSGAGGAFNPFATITDAELMAQQGAEACDDSGTFNPFETIHDDDAFDVHMPSADQESGEEKSPSRFNPFDKEPPLDDKFASLEQPPVSPAAALAKQESEKTNSPRMTPSESSVEEEEEEEIEPLEPYHPLFKGDGFQLMLRQPTKKKLTQNRFWKPVYVRVCVQGKATVVKVFNNDKDSEVMQELVLQPSYNLCDLGLQQFDHFTKCHTVKIQYVFYRERVGVKAERIAPTLSDLTRVRDLKSLKDLVHRPKTTMLLDHAPQSSELLKFGSLDYEQFRDFIHVLEDALFHLDAKRDKTLQYTKDEITVDIVDEYFADIDKDWHIVSHKARVRLYCLAFLTGNPIVELGLNDKRRRGREVVGRKDIIPIKTDEWIKVSDQEINSIVDIPEFEKTKVIKFKPLDACNFEIMRFRVRPRSNQELPLQIRVQMSVINRKVELRADVMIPGYHSSSRRASQTPCEDIQIRIPVPEPWIYMFRVEKRFRYGSVKSATRKPGKIKGLERLTLMAQGMLPTSLIEVSTGQAKYEHIFHSIVWRISRLPERNEGAYKTHLFTCKFELGPHDLMPEDYEKFAYVLYNMPNSTVSRAQIRSISVQTSEDDPDKWVHHLAKYEYRVEMEFSDREPARPPVLTESSGSFAVEVPASATSPEQAMDEEGKAAEGEVAHDSSTSDSDDSD